MSVQGRRRPVGEAGMVTAETAIVLPVVLLVLAAAVAAVVVVGSQLRCVDAAREAARAAARGDPAGQVTSIAARAAPPGATTSARTSGDLVTVTVTAPVRPLGPVLLQVRVSATATAELEPGAVGAVP
jgi:Flp pilus assembly protein TadG